MRTIVFDFDRTLTNYDTLTSMYLWKVKNNHRLFLIYPLIYIFKSLSKFHLISLEKEKNILINIFIAKNEKQFIEECTEFSKKIILNTLCNILHKEIIEGSKVIIISASPEIYIENVLSNCDVIGLVVKNRVNRLKITQHPYGETKLNILKSNGIYEIDEFYFDSKSDMSVLPICNMAFKVKNGKIIKSFCKI